MHRGKKSRYEEKVNAKYTYCTFNSDFQGGTEILESLGYTVYTGYSMEYPRNSKPDYFADHIGNLTVELVLATAEISALIVHVPPGLEALKILQDADPFPSQIYGDGKIQILKFDFKISFCL